MGPADFQAAGLWDPAAPHAAERLALLEWFVARGVTLEQIAAAHRADHLISLAGDLALSTGGTHTLAELAALSGLTPERVQELRRAVGLPAASPDERVFGADDVRAYAGFGAAARLFGDAGDAALFARRRVVARPGRRGGACRSSWRTSRDRCARRDVASWRSPRRTCGPSSCSTSCRRRCRASSASRCRRAIRRTRRARDAQPRDSTTSARRSSPSASSTWWASLRCRAACTPRELAALVERFEDTAHDVATARDGRVVKLIGDEVMFVAVDPARPATSRSTLVERLCRRRRGHAARRARLRRDALRGGDYYGPIVNLAARLAELAVPTSCWSRRRWPIARAAQAALRARRQAHAEGLRRAGALMTVERGRERDGRQNAEPPSGATRIAPSSTTPARRAARGELQQLRDGLAAARRRRSRRTAAPRAASAARMRVAVRAAGSACREGPAPAWLSPGPRCRR